jgi:hypothetical protein
MQWYYSKDGMQLGPVTDAEIRSKIATSEISPGDLVWKEGMRDWLPAGQVGELSALTTTVANPPVPGSPPASPYSPPTFTQSHLPPGVEIPNYLWQSIVVTIFCCWPFGIPAIVYAAKVDGLKARGDIAGAMAASASAKTWCMVSAGVIVGIVVLWMLGAAISAFTSN